MATGDQELVHRLPKLNSPSEYIQWRRRLYAYLRRDDPLLEGLSEEPTTATATTRMNWLKKATRAKSNIILSLGDSALAQTWLFVDGDDKTAKDLWLELKQSRTSIKLWMHFSFWMETTGMPMWRSSWQWSGSSQLTTRSFLRKKRSPSCWDLSLTLSHLLQWSATSLLFL